MSIRPEIKVFNYYSVTVLYLRYIEIVLCPVAFIILIGSCPSLLFLVIKSCLKSWEVKSSSPAFLHTFENISRMFLISLFMLVNIKSWCRHFIVFLKSSVNYLLGGIVLPSPLEGTTFFLRFSNITPYCVKDVLSRRLCLASMSI